ncbi:hypothetical protein V1264_022231 [Littorina saxatilis]|uniref:RING-type domain-containing protein n=1 Tax=Littorina saxatilis TaxID=31220 RepID=A0AAN9AJX9_9CAEN
MATGFIKSEADTCAECFEIYRDPKFLPCHHSFCAQCITDVANRHAGGTFPCPTCREPTSLPTGGSDRPAGQLLPQETAREQRGDV